MNQRHQLFFNTYGLKLLSIHNNIDNEKPIYRQKFLTVCISLLKLAVHIIDDYKLRFQTRRYAMHAVGKVRENMYECIPI
jgi:hypothetical protein